MTIAPEYCNINILQNSQDEIFNTIYYKVQHLIKKKDTVSTKSTKQLHTLSWQIAQYSLVKFDLSFNTCNIIFDYDKYELRLLLLKNHKIVIDNNAKDLIYEIAMSNNK